MRHLVKSVLVSLIITSFIFTPEAFAKPQNQTSIDRDFKNLLNVISKNKKKGLKVSKLFEASEPFFKRSLFKKIRKDSFPYWDKRISKIIFRENQVLLKYEGKVLAAKYVDKGPVAFLVNNKPLLWKDILVYKRMKNRMLKILNTKKAKKISFFKRAFLTNEAFAKLSGSEIADREQSCFTNNRIFVNQICGPCLEGYISEANLKLDTAGSISCRKAVNIEEKCISANRKYNSSLNECRPVCIEGYINGFNQTTGERHNIYADTKGDFSCVRSLKNFCNKSLVRPYNSRFNKCEKVCFNGMFPSLDENGNNAVAVDDESRVACLHESPTYTGTKEDTFEEAGLALFVTLSVLILIVARFRKRNKSTDSVNTSNRSADVWLSTSTCPKLAERGISQVDLPPECRSSSCGSDQDCIDKNEQSLE